MIDEATPVARAGRHLMKVVSELRMNDPLDTLNTPSVWVVLVLGIVLGVIARSILKNRS